MILSSIEHRASPVPPQVMRLRRAVPKIPAKSSHPAALPFYKSRPLRTPSESTLLQLLIPPHFKSFISNVYKNPGGGSPLPAPKFVNSSLHPHHASVRERWPATPILPMASAHFSSPMGGGPPARPLTKLVIPREPRDLLFRSWPHR